ncbi:MAG: sugar ABC transporter ATP-binding protein [Cytophagales bacterium]|nr:MAG: sugar ABC transporter ATP-binding protein [Cytophagales bacterium]
MLELHNISKLFPGVTALDGVSLTVQSGEIHALCGENGAGKSTLLNLLTGNLQPSSGQLRINGGAVVIDGPAHAAKLGISIVYQHLSVVDNLTVAENIFVNRQPRNRFGLIQYRTLYADTQALLNRLNLTDIRPESRVADLSPGQKQMVEIAKALSQNPDMLLLDEPTASLTDRETNTLFTLLRQLRQQGKAIVYISHRLTEIFALADRVSVLKDGQYQGTFPTNELTTDGLIRLMVGRDLLANTTESAATGEVLLSVSGLSGGRFRDVSFTLHRGEILGLAGLIGAGRTEIAQAIFGMDAHKKGEISLRGAIVNIQHPADAVKLGIGYLPEERKTLGLFADQSVAGNIVAVKPPASGAWYAGRRVLALAETYRQQLRIRTPSVQTRVDSLSGGNQQKVMLARWLLTDPDVLMVDEPTHGIDVGAKAEIYELLRQLAGQGKAILLISSELPELLNLADRILVVRDGQLSGELSRAEATEESIMNLATS